MLSSPLLSSSVEASAPHMINNVQHRYERLTSTPFRLLIVPRMMQSMHHPVAQL
ncbi:Hypothetical protein GbCGDNIH9_8588 [Granulibacter bethesdensis]|uniref:Uncharacterized protein n=1 Tax=Granulibacter bethesdensis TaxID=364410 RepID=A0AAC9P8T1_9PROT|nr:Hypothetical protein GbCGDNIH9_8588 [Granulibacter bethesdensis]APH62432.1 Hypothetical protein GbCGDNIH8_8588 [Granulibacter bethesdensis]